MKDPSLIPKKDSKKLELSPNSGAGKVGKDDQDESFITFTTLDRHIKLISN